MLPDITFVKLYWRFSRPWQTLPDTCSTDLQSQTYSVGEGRLSNHPLPLTPAFIIFLEFFLSLQHLVE